jgi:hypothetical protein
MMVPPVASKPEVSAIPPVRPPAIANAGTPPVPAVAMPEVAHSAVPDQGVLPPISDDPEPVPVQPRPAWPGKERIASRPEATEPVPVDHALPAQLVSAGDAGPTGPAVKAEARTVRDHCAAPPPGQRAVRADRCALQSRPSGAIRQRAAAIQWLSQAQKIPQLPTVRLNAGGRPATGNRSRTRRASWLYRSRPWRGPRPGGDALPSRNVRPYASARPYRGSGPCRRALSQRATRTGGDAWPVAAGHTGANARIHAPRTNRGPIRRDTVATRYTRPRLGADARTPHLHGRRAGNPRGLTEARRTATRPRSRCDASRGGPGDR